MITKLDRLQGRDIYENTALAKINELCDAVNKLQVSIKPILEERASGVKICEEAQDMYDNAILDALKNKEVDIVVEPADNSKKANCQENVLTKSLRMDKEFAEDECVRLQGELERTRKALEIAKDTLHWYDDNYDSVVARNTLDEITAPEQKDK